MFEQWIHKSFYNEITASEFILIGRMRGWGSRHVVKNYDGFGVWGWPLGWVKPWKRPLLIIRFWQFAYQEIEIVVTIVVMYTIFEATVNVNKISYIKGYMKLDNNVYQIDVFPSSNTWCCLLVIILLLCMLTKYIDKMFLKNLL